MQRGKTKETPTIADRTAAQHESTRLQINAKLETGNLDWKHIQALFISAKNLVAESKSLDDLKLWYKLFNQAVEPHLQRHGVELNDQWRHLLAANVDIMDTRNEAQQDFPNDENLFTRYKEAVDYHKLLVFPQFSKAPEKDTLYAISLEGHTTALKKLESKKFWDKWCGCLFSRRQPLAQAAALDEDSQTQYTSFNQTPNRSVNS